MKQWILPAEATEPGDLHVVDVPEPRCGPHEVRIRTTALSINARDALVLAGPFGRIAGRDLVPLSDLAGVIDEVGEEVEGWSVGDRVMTAHVPSWVDGVPPTFGPGAGSGDDPGVAAEQVVVDASILVASPDHLTDVEASTLQVAGVTAWNAVLARNPLSAGESALVIGSGGVSLFAAQLVRAVGGEVFVLTRGGSLDARWDAIGVAGHVSSAETGWGERVAALSGGVTKVVQSLGPGAVGESLDAVANGGEVAVLGLADMGAPQVDVLTMIGRQTSIRGVAVGSVRMHRQLAELMKQGTIHPVIDRTVPFEQLPRAYDALGDRGTFGKIVVEVP